MGAQRAASQGHLLTDEGRRNCPFPADVLLFRRRGGTGQVGIQGRALDSMMVWSECRLSAFSDL